MADPNPESIELELPITSMAYGSKGIGRHNGQVIFVPRTLPGDLAKVRISPQPSSFINGELISLLEQSALRIKPTCSYENECGGCPLHQLPRTEEAKFKADFGRQALKRLAKLDQTQAWPMWDLSPSEAYRSRVLLRVEPNAATHFRMGYFGPLSHDLVDIERCQIATTTLNNAIQVLRNYSREKPPSFAYKIDLMAAAQGVLATLIPPPEKMGHSYLKNLITDLSTCSPFLWIGTSKDQTKAPLFLWEEDLGVRFYTKPLNFQQVNPLGNRALRRKILSLTQDLGIQKLLDMHSGNGNLSLALGLKGLKIKGLEFSADAVSAANESCRYHSLAHCAYLKADAHKAIYQLAEKQEYFDLVIADPPRSGMKTAIKGLIALGPKYIIYVSCDPQTLARDLGALCHANYQLSSIESLNFFPGTGHIENIALLKRV